MKNFNVSIPTTEQTPPADEYHARTPEQLLKVKWDCFHNDKLYNTLSAL